MATEEFAAIEIEGILFVARWVVGGGVEGIKIVEDGFDVGPIGYGKAEGLEDRCDAFGDLGDGMAGSKGLPLSGL